MPTLRTKLKQHYLGLLLFSTIMPTVVFGTPPSSIDECNGRTQCERFILMGFSIDVARHGDTIQKIMGTTRIETTQPITHNIQSFFNAMDSNWSPHNSDTEFSEYDSILAPAIQKLGMNIDYNELPLYIHIGSRLKLFILGSHPKQLCSLLHELNQFSLPIHKTVLIGSSTPIYKKDDFANCHALTPIQRQDLEDLAANGQLASDRDIMQVYFSDLELDADFPVISTPRQKNDTDTPTNNQLLFYYLKANPHLFRAGAPVIIAAPQPYMKEAESVLKKMLKEPSIYRFSKAGAFNTYESLNALRSWLMADYYLNNITRTINEHQHK